MKSVEETFMYYKAMEKKNPGSSMLREIMWQYQDMATGGDGGPLGYHPSDYKKECGEEGPSCRDYNYPNYPNRFFQEVCALMNWAWQTNLKVREEKDAQSVADIFKVI